MNSLNSNTCVLTMIPLYSFIRINFIGIVTILSLSHNLNYLCTQYSSTIYTGYIILIDTNSVVNIHRAIIVRDILNMSLMMWRNSFNLKIRKNWECDRSTHDGLHFIIGLTGLRFLFCESPTRTNLEDYWTLWVLQWLTNRPHQTIYD